MLNSNEAWESDRKGDLGEEQALNPPGFAFSGDEKAGLNLNSDSVTSGGEDVSGVSMHVDENAGDVVSGGSVSLVVDFRGSDEARVSDSADDVNEFRVREIKSEDEKLRTVNSNGVSELESEKKLDLVSDGKRKLDVFSKVADSIDVQNDKLDKKEHHKKGSVDDYDSMLSMFDQFAANGKSGAVGYGYEIGDMVWGKVKSHPWWPGHIYSEAFASSSVRRTKREGHVLVAFFGDNSYGWFDPAELIPFEPNFSEKSKQTTSRTFLKAVEEAVDEVNRRSSMALSCRCRNPFNFWPTDVDGYFVAYEAGIYSASQIKKARDNFQPGVMIDFVKQLACSPMSRINEMDSINFIQNKAIVLAFRKAVFEEFDETYAQAFGAHPVRPGPPTTPLEPSKAPLSGRQVFAETLGKGKSSGKSHKSKDQVEKDQYLFKRREEFVESKTPKINLPSQSDISVVPVKSPQTGGVSSASLPPVSNMTEGLDHSANQPVAVVGGEEQIHNTVDGSHHSMVTDAKTLVEGSKMHNDRGIKKVKLQKRPPGEISSESSVAVEKPKKKKKDIDTQSFDHIKMPGAPSKGGALSGKVVEKSVPSAYGENTNVNHQGNHDVAITLLPDSQGTKPVVGNKEIQLELPQLLNDLQALALNPFHGAERCCPAIIRDVFLKFRSVVYQKSLPSLASAENEPKEGRPNALPTVTPSLENPPMENLKNVPSAKPLKPPYRPEDPTKGGRKRGPSDRQEEMTAKKKKKINDLKLLAAEKRASQKMPEGQRGDGKETLGKITGQMPEKKNMQRSAEVQRGDPKDMGGKSMALTPARVSGSEAAKKRQLPVRAANPTMLVMKFPIGAALPSSSELKAKFARFGPLDHSGTRIFWKSFTCRLVYQHKIDAQAALKFASSTTNLFGNTNVKCHIREVPVETSETESAKVQKEDPFNGAPHSLSRDSPVVQHRVGASSIPHPLQQPMQLKSCLKKPPSSDDGGTTAPGGGNGNVRGRVKFMLGGEGSSKTIADDGTHSHGLNYNTEKIHMVVPPSSSSFLPLPSIQFPKAPNNYQHTEILSRNVQNFSSPAAMPMPGPTNIDITQQMLSLLTRCKDVVNNLTGVLGYVPYHPL